MTDDLVDIRRYASLCTSTYSTFNSGETSRGFQIGSTSLCVFSGEKKCFIEPQSHHVVIRNDGATIVSRSIPMGPPVVYVSVNYRCARLALDPIKVTWFFFSRLSGLGCALSAEEQL